MAQSTQAPQIVVGSRTSSARVGSRQDQPTKHCLFSLACHYITQAELVAPGRLATQVDMLQGLT